MLSAHSRRLFFVLGDEVIALRQEVAIYRSRPTLISLTLHADHYAMPKATQAYVVNRVLAMRNRSVSIPRNNW